MIHKSHSPHSNHVRVVFELPSCIWADRIFLVGDFNQWSKNATPLRQDRDGVWRATVDLLAGSRHEFRYMIDGQWKTDSHADGFATNTYGTENSVVIAVVSDSNRLDRASSQVWDRPAWGFTVNADVATTSQTARRPSAIVDRARPSRFTETLAA